jgi:predicted Zn-dependent protease
LGANFIARTNGAKTIMAMDLPKLRKLVALDPADPLSRFAIGKKLFETAEDNAMLEEAVEHLKFANSKSPEHLATYHILAQALIRLDRRPEAREVLQAGIPRVARVGEGSVVTRCNRYGQEFS